MDLAIRIRGLTKSYRRHGRAVRAVSALDLDVPTGSVFGLLGPNGAGKTTVIRALVGLVRPQEGECEVLGARVPDALHRVVDRVGSVVETPGFLPGLTARQTLDHLARVRRMPRPRVAAVLDAVGLADRADDRVGGYSLGMRQRLGVASVLLKDPDLLVLDEPANGLDPSGMSALRTLLRRLGDEGRTVVVSSHLLAEIEQLCDEVAVMDHGTCVADGRLPELLGAERRVRARVHGDPSSACTALRTTGLACEVTAAGELLVDVPPGDAWRVSRTLAERGLFVTELGPVHRSLEDRYLELVADHRGDTALEVWGR
jgi:ABC-2 type transport system ATP-binding protein